MTENCQHLTLEIYQYTTYILLGGEFTPLHILHNAHEEIK